MSEGFKTSPEVGRDPVNALQARLIERLGLYSNEALNEFIAQRAENLRDEIAELIEQGVDDEDILDKLEEKYKVG